MTGGQKDILVKQLATVQNAACQELKHPIVKVKKDNYGRYFDRH